MLLLWNDQLEQTCPCSYLNLGGGEEVIRVAPVIFQAFVIFITAVAYKGLFTWRWGTPGGWGKLKYGGAPHLSCKHDQIKMGDYMDKRVTPPKRVTSCTWGPPPPTGPKSSLPVAIFANCANCWSLNSSQTFQTGLYGLSLLQWPC